MVRETESTTPFWGKELKRDLVIKMSNKGDNKVTTERLSEISDAPVDTLKKVFSRKRIGSLTILLYFVFALEMNKNEAQGFLQKFGYTINALRYSPYSAFYPIIINNMPKPKQIPAKEFVDDLLEK